VTQTLTLSWSDGSSTSLTKSVAQTDEGGLYLDFTVAGATTDKRVLAAIDVSALKLLYILSDKDITIQTNDGTTPDNTLTITANKPLVWYSGCGLPNPLTVDVVDIYVTNAGGTTATVNIRALQDATP